jgi:succinoglycan biosynthesis protein ExoM
VTPTVSICIATKNRPDGLRTLLDSLRPVMGRADIVVVDDDDHESGRLVCAPFVPAVRYLRNAGRGIAAARNTALANVSPDQPVVFVDDDEWVSSENWLDLLIGTANATGADVVSGPVIPAYKADAPRWVINGQFHTRPRYPSGSRVRMAATNNTLVMPSFRRLMKTPFFDEAFSLTGGSDTDFFHRLVQSGGQLVWCDEATVHELVTADRTTPRWIFRRGLRSGNVLARITEREKGRCRTAVDALARIALGLGRTVFSLIRLKVPSTRDVGPLLRGLGTVQYLTGSMVHEYDVPK